MGWTDDDDGVLSSRDELFERVVRRGDQLRGRRRAALLAALPVVLLVVLLPAALRGGDEKPTTVAASQPTVTGGAAPSVLAMPSTTVAAGATEEPTTTMVPLTIVAPTTTVPRPTTTVRPSAPLTIVPPPPTTVPPEEPTTTVPPTTIPPNQPPGTTCNPPMMTTSATTDKQSYTVGDVVRATATWTNTSGSACWYKHGYWGNWVVDSTGKIVTPQAWPPFDLGEWRQFQPGESSSHSWTWDLKVCTFNNTTACINAPPGTYKIIFDYEPFAEPTVNVQIVAS